MNRIFSIAAVVGTLALVACDDADVARQNLTKAADNFEIPRRVILYNSIRGENVMITEGRCSVEPGTLRISVICKVGPEEYIRNFYGNSDNTLYFVEQMEASQINVYHYRRTFKPQALLPDIDFRRSAKALTTESGEQ